LRSTKKVISLRKEYIEENFHKKRLEYIDYATTHVEGFSDLNDLNIYKTLSLEEVLNLMESLTENSLKEEKSKVKQVFQNLKKITYTIKEDKNEILLVLINKGIHFTIFNTLNFYSDILEQLEGLDLYILVN
jgi:hypothetical protein